MKRFLILFTTILLCFCFTSCNNEATVTDREKVVVNLPADDTVNGYRVSEKKNESMPDTIKGELVGTETEDSKYTIDSDLKTENNESYEETYSGSYCANKNSKIFHKATCGSVTKMKEENKEFYSDRTELISKSYTPCKVCNP